jgi:peptidoglycan/xylan/chitin deacetylase (PgdA/CDA1 family)
MEKEMLVIHDINDIDFFNFPLKEYHLTFDDGLFSQYFYWPIIKTIRTKKTFFISTDLVDFGKPREQFKINKPEFLIFPTTFECMKMYKENNDKTNYIRKEELEQLIEYCEIGGHGHKHNHISFYNGKEKEKMIINDIELMMEWFQKNLNLKPITYAFPFYESDGILESILRKFGFKTFIGARKQFEDEKERIKKEIFWERKI